MKHCWKYCPQIQALDLDTFCKSDFFLYSHVENITVRFHFFGGGGRGTLDFFNIIFVQPKDGFYYFSNYLMAKFGKC